MHVRRVEARAPRRRPPADRGRPNPHPMGPRDARPLPPMSSATLYLVRVTVAGDDGEQDTCYLFEWHSIRIYNTDDAPTEEEIEDVLRAAAWPWILQQGWGCTFEARREGERWSGRRYSLRPALEVRGF
jgi:hypothetical protein